MFFKKIINLLIIIFFSLTVDLCAEHFGPWNSNVKVLEKKRYKKKYEKRIHNGVQGTAYSMIRFFQVVISPQDGPNCRFHPVCSTYGKIAVERHGALLGSFLAGDRLIRCNPFNSPGKDPVPEFIFNEKNDRKTK